MDVFWYWGLFGLKLGLFELLGKYCYLLKVNGLKLFFEICFKCILGMIWFVLILLLKRGIILFLYVVIGLIVVI